MSAVVDVRRLVVEDATALMPLRREALEADPLAFAASIEDDRGLVLDLVRSYVTPRARSLGVGRALLHAAVEQARTWGLEQVQLSVSEPAVAAKRMYESAGFRSWGRQPRALHWRGRFVDEHHLTLDLREQGG